MASQRCRGPGSRETAPHKYLLNQPPPLSAVRGRQTGSLTASSSSQLTSLTGRVLFYVLFPLDSIQTASASREDARRPPGMPRRAEPLSPAAVALPLRGPLRAGPVSPHTGCGEHLRPVPPSWTPRMAPGGRRRPVLPSWTPRTAPGGRRRSARGSERATATRRVSASPGRSSCREVQEGAVGPRLDERQV